MQKDNTDLGMAFVNLRLSGNSVTASRPNFTSAESDYSSVVECYRVASVYEGVTAMSTAVPRVLGTVLQRNRANNCDAAFHTGTGAGGIVLNSTTLGGAPTLWVDEPTPGASGGATDVVVIP